MEKMEKTQFNCRGEALPKNRYRFKTKIALNGSNSTFGCVPAPVSNDRLLRICDIVGKGGFLPISKSTFFANVKLGIYPDGIKISPRCTAWREADILQIARHGFNGVELI